MEEPTTQDMVDESLRVMPTKIVKEFTYVTEQLEAGNYKEALASLMGMVIIHTAHLGQISMEADCAHTTAHENADKIEKLVANIHNLASLIGEKLEREFDD